MKETCDGPDQQVPFCGNTHLIHDHNVNQTKMIISLIHKMTMESFTNGYEMDDVIYKYHEIPWE